MQHLQKNRGVGSVIVNQLALFSDVQTCFQPSFVLNCFHTLSFSVSCNSFACLPAVAGHSYENCRVCTNNSHSGTRASSSSKNRRSFFSCTYELPIFYLLCFDIHASDGGCTPHPTHSSRFVRGTANPGCAARRTSLSTFNCELSTTAWENPCLT